MIQTTHGSKFIPVLAILFFGFAAAAAGPAGIPKIHFAETTHDFGRFAAGGRGHCEFVFTNEGTATLEITNVQPTCGCTVAGTWTREVPPGGTGVIPLDYHAPDFAGEIQKGVSVFCNDPAQLVLVLQLKAMLYKPIELNPYYAILKSVIDLPSSVTGAVRIVSNLEEPITLSEPESTNRFFATELKTLRPGKEFELTVRTLPPLPPHNPQEFIRIRTSSSNAPVITVPTVVIVEPLLVIAPPVLVLPASPLKQSFDLSLMIRNNDARPLALSEAKLVLKDPATELTAIAVEMKELEPGRQFVLSAKLPEGFAIPDGKTLVLQVKTSSPKRPLVEVEACVTPCL